MEEDLGVNEALALKEEDLEEIFWGRAELRLDMDPKLRSQPPLLILTGVVEGESSSTMIVCRGSDDDEGFEDREAMFC